MTHTLHRIGDWESLSQDFPILAHVARGHNEQGSEEKLRKISQIFMKYTDLNFGCAVVGNKYSKDVQEILENMKVGTHAVFRDKNALIKCMKELKDADLGISIVISGCFDLVDECCKHAGIKWHLKEYSLGFHGNIDRLPSEDYLQILTMCGHNMVAKLHIEYLVKKIKKDKISCEDAGRELAKPCVCGIFNPYRAVQILRRLVDLSK